jgi:hypothetical protein
MHDIKWRVTYQRVAANGTICASTIRIYDSNLMQGEVVARSKVDVTSLRKLFHVDTRVTVVKIARNEWANNKQVLWGDPVTYTIDSHGQIVQ